MLLNCHTCYSYHYGTIKPRELLAMAQEHGYQTIALTDINNTSSALDFVRLSHKTEVRPVLGIDFRNGVVQQFVGLAINNEGFLELNNFLSHHRHHGLPFPDQAPDFQHVFVIYPFRKCQNKKLKEHEFLGVRPQDINRLKFSPCRQRQEKLVAFPTVTFRHKRDFNSHRLLRAIGNNTLLSKLTPSEQGLPADKFLSSEQLLQAYRSFPALVENAHKLANHCRVEFCMGHECPHQNLESYTGSAEEDWQLLQQQCREGLTYRYPNADQKVLNRLKMEMETIREKGFLAYFLINWDIINYARRKGYFYVGRGSGANSIVAYLLRITDVDPIELDLYFERFINLYRQNPPDFDIDFSWKDRDDVTRYIFERFGQDKTALLGSYVTFQYRAVIRELGKVFGLPKHEIDKLSAGAKDPSKLDHLSKLVLQYGQYIHGFPSHMSVHAGGIIIAQKPIHWFTATDLPPKGYPTTHFDMLVAEDAGLYKLDILGQRGLGKIKDGLEVAMKNHPEKGAIDIHDMKRFKQDEKIKDLLRNGKAIGCFYVESPAMRMLLRKLRVDDYLGLVAASSVIRPGVAKSGMMREYILRFRYPERRKEADPTLAKLMPETYGVMVYQEDVIKVAHLFAGLSLAEADMLRRGMSGKFRSREEFQKVKDKFFFNCREKGYPETLTAEVWRQIESFAGYAFAKGHSASYAVESYQSLFLKAHYPLEYMVATINNGGGFYGRELYVHEARMHGARIHPPCVNTSDVLTIIHGKDIFLGFDMVHDLELRTIREVQHARQQEGLFESMHDFLQRVMISLEQLTLLIRINAFRFTNKSKKALLWEAHFLLGGHKKSNPPRDLFKKTQRKHYQLPSLNKEPFEDAFDELELLGFPLCNPFKLLPDPPLRPLTAEQLKDYPGRTITTFGYYVTAKHTRTANGKTMHFGTFLDSEGQFLDTVHFPPVAAKYPFRGKGIYCLTGEVVEEFGFYTIEVNSMEKLPFIDDPRYSESIPRKYKMIAAQSKAAEP